MSDTPEPAAGGDEPQPPQGPAAQEFEEMMRAAAHARSQQPSAPEQRRQRRAAALAQERDRRLQRRRSDRQRSAVSLLGGFVRAFFVVSVASGLIATILVWLTPPEFIAASLRRELGMAELVAEVQPRATGMPTPNWLQRIGIVAGHRGPNPDSPAADPDPGAVCLDGMAEADINFDVAQLIVRKLRVRGYTVDLLDEFDPRLEEYQATALVSIHANTCLPFTERVSGFLVAAAAARVAARSRDDILVDCIARHYARGTGLERHEGVTEDMTSYHTFREINLWTPAVIIETGFMLADRELLTERSDVVAEGVTNGILCFLDARSDLPARSGGL